MTEREREQRNFVRLGELYATLRPKLHAILCDLEGHGLRPRIQCAYRSPAEQAALYKGGYTQVRYGFHQVSTPGGIPEALAADVLDDDHPEEPPTRYLLMLAASARAHGMETGILWGLSPREQWAVNDAISRKDWGARVKVGWDPTHVQAKGITIAQARRGLRPG